MVSSSAYDALPVEIRSVVPRDKIDHIVRVGLDEIRLQIAYDGVWDKWKKVDDKWVYVNNK